MINQKLLLIASNFNISLIAFLLSLNLTITLSTTLIGKNSFFMT